LTHVMEFRRADWLCDEVFDLMRKHRIGLCIHDLIDRHPRMITADLTYVRFHGAGSKYGGSYSLAKLRAWARWMAAQSAAGRDVFAYFNNDAEAHAIRNALTLRELLPDLRRLTRDSRRGSASSRQTGMSARIPVADKNVRPT
jgi:uncharacterized protein YecE (DUF72 family)